jgi:hypothetical protein
MTLKEPTTLSGSSARAGAAINAATIPNPLTLDQNVRFLLTRPASPLDYPLSFDSCLDCPSAELAKA